MRIRDDGDGRPSARTGARHAIGTAERNRRSLGRVIEYVEVAVIACTLAATAFYFFERGLGTPMALIETALAG